MATVFLPKPCIRKLANGQTVTYPAKTWQCRFYVKGRGMERFSTGLQDKAAAQCLADTWEAQSRAGQPYDPPTGRRKKKSPLLKHVDLDGVAGPIQSPLLLQYIRLSRQLGITTETILNEVERLLSSGLDRRESLAAS